MTYRRIPGHPGDMVALETAAKTLGVSGAHAFRGFSENLIQHGDADYVPLDDLIASTGKTQELRAQQAKVSSPEGQRALRASALDEMD